MSTVRQTTIPQDRDLIYELFAEYLRWGCARIYEEYQAVFDAESIIVHDMESLDIFMPPNGLLFLAHVDGLLAGCACTRTIGNQVAELKRMYVRPSLSPPRDRASARRSNRQHRKAVGLLHSAPRQRGVHDRCTRAVSFLRFPRPVAL